MLQEVEPLFIPAGAHAATIVVEFPPGDPGTPPHRHPGPAFGYVLDGEMVFELEGARRVVWLSQSCSWNRRRSFHVGTEEEVSVEQEIRPCDV